ncbi:hypothetical protein ACIQU6_29580 [Streptomyces sp. NPDC090442]|uniref:hypothetical protein n=1 Tax=Streptomyces sp. NPDC090442 TaxID=3365962 RepID=UPI00381EE3C4
MADPTNDPEPAVPDNPAEGPEGAQLPGGTDPVEPAGPRPLGLAVTPTGQPAVDAGLARLAGADHLPVSGHLGMYEDVHRGLRDTLASLDQHPGPSAPSPTHDRPDH